MNAQAFWLVGRLADDRWEPRWDYPPCADENIAKAVAESLAKASETPHQARGPWELSLTEGRHRLPGTA